MAKTKIRITQVNANRIGWHGLLLERYMNESLCLRTARKAGDEEVVNNFQLGQLNRAKSSGEIDFIKL